MTKYILTLIQFFQTIDMGFVSNIPYKTAYCI